MLNGAITALVTPMKKQGRVDFASLERLIEFQINNDVVGLVTIGSTGEAMGLTLAEKIAVVKHVITVVALRVKVIVGVSYASTAEAGQFIEQLNTITGIDYIMVVTPYYVKPSQDGLYQHFAYLAKISKQPLILYNVPGRTGCNLADTTTLKLAQDFSNIVGLKDATGDIARGCYLIKHKPAGFAVYSGDDATALAFMLCGGNGVISVVSNIVPKEFSTLCSLAMSGEPARAIAINNAIMELHTAMFVESNPIPVKWSLYRLGIIASPSLRLPLTPLSKAYQESLKPILNKIINGL